MFDYGKAKEAQTYIDDIHARAMEVFHIIYQKTG